MKILIPGGTGQIGMILGRAFAADGHNVVALSRHPASLPWRVVQWDAESLGDWTKELDGADVVINLAGRSVNCRYNEENVFPRTDVMGELKKYVRVQLYTDSVPDPKLSAAESKRLGNLYAEWRDQLAKEPALPTYLIFQPAPDEPLADDVPKGRILDRRNGQIFNTADFVRFLSEPVKGVQTAAR